ncbi:MAG: class I SAM-dependent methyltransferase [Pirellulales bacterium]
MLRLGTVNVADAGLTDRIELRLADAKQMPFADGQFSCVMSNSIVHHIPLPAEVLADAWRVLGSGGLWLFRDLLRPIDEATLQRLVEQYAADADSHQRQLFADSLRAALTVDEVGRLAVELGLSPDDVRQTSDRHWTWTTRKH